APGVRRRPRPRGHGAAEPVGRERAVRGAWGRGVRARGEREGDGRGGEAPSGQGGGEGRIAGAVSGGRRGSRALFPLSGVSGRAYLAIAISPPTSQQSHRAHGEIEEERCSRPERLGLPSRGRQAEEQPTRGSSGPRSCASSGNASLRVRSASAARAS